MTASVSNGGGTVAPGATQGTLQITGSYTQTSSGKLQIELGGTTPGTQYDRLHVSNAMTLAGTLQVTLSSFAPAQDDVFDILNFTSLTGTFATLSLPALGSALQWDTSRLYADGTIAVVLPGDFNHNGVVDAADYVVWSKGPGNVNDFLTWRANFGHSAGAESSATGDSPAQAAVPEPATLVIFIIAAAGMSTRRRCV